MIEKIALLTLLACSTYAGTTTTDTTFTPQVDMPNDAYGNAIYQREVQIKTNNFKVDNFWDKFSANGQGNSQNEYSAISKIGKIQISVEATSVCTLDSLLNEEGCSGQKPFVINNEALTGTVVGDTLTLAFQKDYNLSNDTILYNRENPFVFYPLDVDRTEKFYKTQVDNSKSFFGFFTSMFNAFSGGFFSSFFNHEVIDSNAESAEDIRKRYIANIVSGIDQEHLLAESSILKTNELNNPVSLIDYTENVSSTGSCNLFFFKFPEDSTFCSMMSGMPFMSMFTSVTPATNYTIDTIQTDTENSLITFASAYTKTDIKAYQDAIVYEKQSQSTGLISGMIDMMKCMFFGCAKKEDIKEPMDSYYAYTDETAINLTMAVTNEGTNIDGFETFRLMGIHSLTGNDHQCHVKESERYDKWDDHNFVGNETGEITTTTCDGFSFMGMCMGSTTTVTTTVVVTKSAKSMSETVQSDLGIDLDRDDDLTSNEWLTWCDYMVDKYQGNVTTECTGFFFFKTCKEVPAGIEEDGYEVLSYTNSTKRGLLLDLKRIKLAPEDKAVTLRYKLLSTTNN